MTIENAENIKKLKEKSKEKNKKYVKKLYENLSNFEGDTKKEDRLSKNLCKTCYYLKNDEICLDQVTSLKCKSCGETTLSFNHLDRICYECQKKYNLCKRCGDTV